MKLNNILTGILIVCILCGIVTAATTISDTSISVDNLILGGQAIVAYTDVLNTKLSGIETLADVTDCTNVNSAGAVMESDIPDQSFTNLLENGNFESWSAGTSAAPDGWTIGGVGPSIARSADSKISSYSVNLTYGSTSAQINQYINDYARYAGREMSIAFWAKTSTASCARITINDGHGNHVSQFHTGGGDWELLVISFTCNAAISQLRVVPQAECAGSVFFDGAILVEGLVCPAHSPKPIVDDGIMLQEHTPSSASDYGLTGQWCYDDDYIYVCNATDTWIRTSLTTW